MTAAQGHMEVNKFGPSLPVLRGRSNWTIPAAVSQVGMKDLGALCGDQQLLCATLARKVM